MFCLVSWTAAEYWPDNNLLPEHLGHSVIPWATTDQFLCGSAPAAGSTRWASGIPLGMERIP